MRRASIGMVAASWALSLGATSVSAQGMNGSRHQFPEQTGEALYEHICQGCHMPDGKGAVGAGAYPALAGDPRLEASGYPIAIVVHGRKAMPSFGWALSDVQVAAVVNYVRGHFGNAYADAVSAADVKASR
jgi:mono/diheme cytochrome c family protein